MLFKPWVGSSPPLTILHFRNEKEFVFTVENWAGGMDRAFDGTTSTESRSFEVAYKVMLLGPEK
jgi:hypothetical protein